MPRQDVKMNKIGTRVEQNLTRVEQNELIKEKKRKENIYSYSYYRDGENQNSDLLNMFDDEPPKTDPYKNVFKIYMNDGWEKFLQ